VTKSFKIPISTVQLELTPESFPDESQGIPQLEIDDQSQEAAPLLRSRGRSKIMRVVGVDVRGSSITFGRQRPLRIFPWK